MLTRLYVDNFKCFQNLTLELDPFTLLMGPNGAGKTTAIEILRLLADLLTQRSSAEALFPVSTLTRWDRRSEQLFEVDVRLPARPEETRELPEGVFRYRLRVSHDRYREKNRIVEEDLTFEGRKLYRAWLDESERSPTGIPSFRAQLFKDNGQEGPTVFMDWSLSGIGRVQPREENQLLQRFRRFFDHLVILCINPDSLSAETRQPKPMIDFNGGNFAAWLVHLLGSEALACREAERALIEGMLPDLALFQVESEGSLRFAKAVFRGNGGTVSFALDELSAGQRAMVILEHALAAVKVWGSALIVDEPANYLALREVQPLLNGMRRATQENRMQVMVSSHHPVSIDLLAESSGRWLERTALGATRSVRVSDVVEGLSDTSLPLSELAARGWIQADPLAVGQPTSE